MYFKINDLNNTTKIEKELKDLSEKIQKDHGRTGVIAFAETPHDYFAIVLAYLNEIDDVEPDDIGVYAKIAYISKNDLLSDYDEWYMPYDAEHECIDDTESLLNPSRHIQEAIRVKNEYIDGNKSYKP